MLFLCLPYSGQRMTSLNNRRDCDGMGDDNDDVIGAATTSVLNMSDTPRIQTSALTEQGDTSTMLPQHRKPRQYQPSHKRVLKKLLCTKAVIPSERDAFCDRFDKEMGPDALKCVMEPATRSSSQAKLSSGTIKAFLTTTAPAHTKVCS
jgi:hypothetical protein